MPHYNHREVSVLWYEVMLASATEVTRVSFELNVHMVRPSAMLHIGASAINI